MSNDCLQLIVETHSCACGNRWTNSYQIHSTRDGRLYGGRATGAERSRLSTTSLRHLTVLPHSSCFRCIDPAVAHVPVHPDYNPYPDRNISKPLSLPVYKKQETTLTLDDLNSDLT